MKESLLEDGWFDEAGWQALFAFLDEHLGVNKAQEAPQI